MLRQPLLAKEPAAVDDERGSGDELGSDEIRDGLGDVVRRADRAQQGLGRAAFLLTRLDGDGPRRDPTNAYVGRERSREHAGQHRLRGLGGAVRRKGRPGLVGGDVLDQDQEAEVGGAEMGPGRLGDEEAAFRRGAECGVPIRLLDLVDGLGGEAVRRRVHDQVEPAELAGSPLDECGGRPWIGHVAVGASGGQDAEPVGLEARRDRAADPPGPAGDECSREVGHARNDKLPRA